MNLDALPFSGIVTIRDKMMLNPDACRLESGDPEFDVPKHIKYSMVDAIFSNKTHYTKSDGIVPLKEAVLEKLKNKNNITDLTEDNILVTNGGMHALFVTFRSLLNDEGGEVIVPCPNWTGSTSIIEFCGGTVVRVPIIVGNDELKLVQGIEAAITTNTKAILLNNPHNPTGIVFDQEAVRRINDIAIRHNVVVISDEAYEDVCYSPLLHSGSINENVISTFSLSKSYSMSGLRIGYIVCRDKKIISRMKKVILYSSNGVNSVTQWASIDAISGSQECIKEMNVVYRKKRDCLVDTLNETNLFKCENPMGAFYVWAEIIDKTYLSDDKPSWSVSNILSDYGIGSAPGDIFGPSGKNYIRFAYSCPMDHIKRACNILSSF